MTTPSLADVAAQGSRLETLRAMRDYTATALEETGSARDRAALLARMESIILQIDELTPKTEEDDPIDALFDDA